MFDLDIDIKPSTSIKDIFPNIAKASMVVNDKLKPHPAGVYFENMPIDIVTGLSAIPFKQADMMGFFKVDFLNLHMLENFSSKEQIRTLIKKEPKWELLLDENVVVKLSQIHKHFDKVKQIKPCSIIDLAELLALIRPAKCKYFKQYLADRERVKTHIFDKPSNGKYHFKKGHAISYATNIVLQLHLSEAGLL